MRDTVKPIELQLVIQIGGTSSENYLHSFCDKAAANGFIQSAERASYRCLGPFPLILPGVSELADASNKTVDWLNLNGFRDTPLANDLNSALALVERSYPPH